MNETLVDWSDAPATAPVEPAAPDRRRRVLTGIGAVATAAVLAAGGTYALTHGSSGTSTPAALTGAPAAMANGAAPGGTANGAGPGGLGFAPTSYRFEGTVTAVGTSTVTVRTASGTTTYSVGSATHLLRSGATATLAQFAVGDSVRGSTTTQGGTVLNDLVSGLPAGGPPGGTTTS